MTSFRRDFITKPIFGWARGVLPAMSETEREALEAGDVWGDAELFTGNPDWYELLGDAAAVWTPKSRPSSRTGRAALCHGRRLEDELGVPRPSAGGLGLHQAARSSA